MGSLTVVDILLFLVFILTVTDTLDMIVSKSPKSFNMVVEYLNRCRGSQFDSEIVEGFSKYD